jgi:hypothetical protein
LGFQVGDPPVWFVSRHAAELYTYWVGLIGVRRAYRRPGP